jgi:alpha-methylacyl-CoA racemase
LLTLASVASNRDKSESVTRYNLVNAGHYIALSGALHDIGLDDKPVPPLNLVGDFGGALYLVFGMLAALIHVRATGQGQVVDAAMTDGAASLMTMVYGLKAASLWTDQRCANLLDGGAHMYDTYRCADGKWVAIGSLEPQFYALLLEKVGLSDDPAFANQMDRGSWPRSKVKTRERHRLAQP